VRCPNCKADLVESKFLKRYETLMDHVCDPNGESPARPFFKCMNVSCDLYFPSTEVYWGYDGDCYYRSSNKVVRSWFRENGIDLQNPKTFKRKGSDALDSTSRRVTDEMLSTKRYWWQRLRTRLHRKWLKVRYGWLRRVFSS